ncbi:hypothetical protein SCHPADRAFT_945950 [Schizopora paradoxa]|uniref:Uncharacterized protein n=1 Tax=Schizopora paradoxa TaxID=27342 RepID=A0A0H2R4B1_9AGAM|nr:hypothetical protein SCHPADRAFT_945950 [Schizopora paradoxa]
MTTAIPSFLWSVLCKLWDFCPVLVPTIIAYIAIAPVSLKVWIGAQNAPRRHGTPKITYRLTNILSEFLTSYSETFLSALILAMACLFHIFVKGDLESKKMTILGMLVLPGSYSIWRVPIWSSILFVGRPHQGVPFFTQTRAEKPSVIVVLITLFVGFGICIGALLGVSNTYVQGCCQAILYGSYLHLLLLGTVTHTGVERDLASRVIVVGLAGIACSMIVVIGMLFHAFGDGSMPPTDGGFESSSVLVQSAVSWLCAWANLEVITLLYRMDYAFALKSGRTVAPVVRVRQREGTSSADATSTGKVEEDSYVVVIPASLKLAFDKPYFNASIAGLIVSELLMASFAAYLEEFRHDGLQSRLTSRTMLETGPEWVRFYLNVVAAPFVCAFPMALAYMRGESRKVWEYRERWMDAPECVLQDVVSSESLPPAIEPSAFESSTWLELCEGKVLEEKKEQRV